MGMSTDCLLLGQKKGLSILERRRHVHPYIVFILRPSYGFMLRTYIYIHMHIYIYIYIYYIYITFPPAVHAVCTRMNSPLPWPNTCFCVPATCVCGCNCILNCVYVLKCRNTMWLGTITCAWLARLSVSMCPCLSETCVLILSVWAFWWYCSDMLSFPDVRLITCSK